MSEATEGQAPWDKDGEEFDADKARRYLSNLLSDKQKLQDRLDTQKKGSEEKYANLEAENVKLKVQLNTGLSDKQVARLVGDTFEEKMKDAEAYAEETGFELHSFFESEDSADTPGDGQGANDDGEQEPEKQVNRNFNPPQNGGQGIQAPDYGDIVKKLDLQA